MHYQVSPSFSQVKEGDEIQNPQTALASKLDCLLEQIISFRLSQAQLCKELGFDLSRETYLKGEQNIYVCLELKKEYWLVIMFEMNALKCEFFDCDQYVTTIDDLVSTLIDTLHGAADDME